MVLRTSNYQPIAMESVFETSVFSPGRWLVTLNKDRDFRYLQSYTSAPTNIKVSQLIVVLAAFLTYVVVHRLFLWRYVFSPLRFIPGPPLGHPIFGQFLNMTASESCILKREWVKQYGPVVRIPGSIGTELLLFMKPEALHQILVADWLQYPRPSYVRHILGIIAGYGLLTVTGDEHKQMRKAISPAFSISNLMAQTDMYYKSIDGLLEIMQSEISQEVDPNGGKQFMMYEWMAKATLDIVCETAFGYNADSLHDPHNELVEAYEQLLSLQSEPNLARMMLYALIPGMPKLITSEWAYSRRHWFSRFLPPLDKIIDSMHRIKRVSADILQQKMQDVTAEGSNMNMKRDIMSLLVRARQADLDEDKGVYTMSDQAMMDQVLTFLTAGHETTAAGLSWTLWLLANDKESQDRLRAEVRPIFAENPHPDYRTLKGLQWLDCVVMESLRVMPPVPMTVRTAAQTDYIEGVLVPKGTVLFIAIRVINTWKKIWGEDAEEFSPKRWLALPKEYHPVYSSLSFIAGPHACIGKTMAIIEMKAVLAALISNFEFEPAYKGQVAKPMAGITMRPRDGMPLRVRRVSEPLA